MLDGRALPAAAFAPRRWRRLARCRPTSSASACSAPSRPGRRPSPRSLAERYETVWNPEYGRPYTEIGRPERAVDELGVHAHRAHALLVRGLPRPRRDAGAVLRHRRVHDGPLPRGLPRRARDRLRRARRPARTTCVSCAGSTCPGGTTGSASSRSSGAGCTSGTSSTRAPAGARGCSSRGRSTSGSRRCRRSSTGCWADGRAAQPRAATSSRRRRRVGTASVAKTGNDADRIDSGWWVGVPRRKVAANAPLELSARSGARPSSAP